MIMHPKRCMDVCLYVKLPEANTCVPVQSCCVVISQVDVDIATHISISDDGPERR